MAQFNRCDVCKKEIATSHSIIDGRSQFLAKISENKSIVISIQLQSSMSGVAPESIDNTINDLCINCLGKAIRGEPLHE